MAIRIIKPGNLEHDTYKGTCSKCGCVIECVSADINYEDRPGGKCYVNCPTCHGLITPSRKKNGNLHR